MFHCRCQRKVDATILGVILFRLSENSILREHLQRRARQAIIGENSIQRKLYSTVEIQNSERRNSEYALTESQRELESQREQFWEANQSKLNVREYICEADWMKDHLHNECYAWSCREFEELKRCCYQEGNYKKTKIGIISYAAWSGITNSESILLRSWLTEQLWRTYVPHQALIPSSSRMPSREVGMPRNTRENMSIPGNVIDRQHVRRDREELHNDSRNLATPWGIADDVEDSEKRRNWE